MKMLGGVQVADSTESSSRLQLKQLRNSWDLHHHLRLGLDGDCFDARANPLFIFSSFCEPASLELLSGY
jgi:hypothetical protein